MNTHERFLRKVDKGGENGCWIWIGSYFSGKNRGQFWWERANWLAHRAAWVLFRGPIPDDKMICHLCNNERCVNPDHLYVGDQASNMRDRDLAGRTSRWSHRYNFVRSDELIAKVVALRQEGHRIEDICTQLNIGRTTYYRISVMGAIDHDMTREVARKNYRAAKRAS